MAEQRKGLDTANCMRSRTISILATPAVVLLLASGLRAADKVTFDDQLMPLLRNECVSCHNPDKKKAGLDVSTYQALLAGSDGGPVVNVGDPDNSSLYQVVAHVKDPYMPKGKGKLADKDIDIIKKWISGGALENVSGKPASVKNKPKLNLSVAADVRKPRGPVVMPRDLVLEPVTHTRRPGALLCLASSPWAPLVAVGGQHQVLLYNTQTLELVGVLPFPEGEPYVAKFSRNGSMLLVGGGIAAKSGHVVLFDVASGRRITQVGDEFDAVIAADITPDQSMLALGGPGKTVKIYSTADGQLIKAIKKHTDWVTAIAYSPDGVLLASGDRQGGLWVWEAKSGNEFYGLSGHKAAITDVCFRDDSNVLASASEDGTVKAWEMQGGKEIKSWNAHGGGVLSINFTHDGRIVTCGRDKVVRAWKPDGGGLFTTPPFNDIALHAAFDGEGERIVAGDWTGAIRVFDASNAKPVGELTADPPSLSERLDLAIKNLAETQAANDQAAADLAVAGQASYKAATDLQAANLALAEAKTTLDRARLYEQSALQAIQSAQAATDVQAPPSQEDADSAASRDAVASQRSAFEKACEEHRIALDSVAKAQQALSALEKTQPQRAQEAKAAAEHLMKVTPHAAQAGAALAEARARIGRLKAAQFNVTVCAARDELWAKQSELEKLTAAADEAKSTVEKANSDVLAAEKGLSEAPQRLKARQDAVDKAREVLAAVHSAQEAANAAVADKKSLAEQASELVRKLSAAAAKTSDDRTLADAAAKAAASLDLLNHDVQQAQEAAAARADAITQAQSAVDAAQSALTREQADIESAPKLIESLKHSAVAASEDAGRKKSEADALAASVAAVKAKVDQLSAQYRQMSQEVAVTTPPAIQDRLTSIRSRTKP